MKKTRFVIALMALLMMGCSKDESHNDASENLLKRGSTVNRGSVSISYSGNSVDEPFELIALGDGSKVMLHGKCSGSIVGYGGINPDLSSYWFDDPEAKANIDYGFNPPELPFDYEISGKGRVSLNTKDYFEFSFTKALYIPINYESGDIGPGEPPFKGAHFGCPISYYTYIDNDWKVFSQGEAKITFGAGRFKDFPGKTLQFNNYFNAKSINRLTGEINLRFTIR